MLKIVMFSFVAFLAIAALAPTRAAVAADGHAAIVEQSDDGVIVTNKPEFVHISVCGNNVLHIVASLNDQPPAASTPWVVGECRRSPFEFKKTGTYATLRTAQLEVNISLTSGRLSYRTASGEMLLSEADEHPRQYSPAPIGGDYLYQVSDHFSPDETEGIYGLGQHQNGVFDYRGAVVDLSQENTDVAVPLLVSTKGYGIMWNTASHSEFDNRFPRNMKLTARATNAIDYYFFYGPEIDQIIHEYRDLTGHAPLFRKWAYGFIQSKDRYISAQQLLDIGEEYRTHHVPLDLVVQDWYWWKHQGDPEYSDAYLKPHPDVPGALNTLHGENLHAIVSIWPLLSPESSTYATIKEEDGLIPGTNIYDPTNPKAKETYWQMLPSKLLAQGWDGFWLDASEPEANLDNKQLFIGSGAQYTNIFPLLHTENVYTHWRQTSAEKRVFILTRSAFLGQQQNSAVTWSGDIYGTFLDLRRQVPAGLNFAVSGIPYWTTDIGGYTSPLNMKSDAYRELYARWYEFGAFCPIFRTHGHRDENEVFSYGPITPTLVAFDKLRYRLMPYIYSLAWRVTSEDYTLQRPLIMDWRNVEKVRDIGDQFMFGPAILVNPVTVEGALSRSVYLPPAAGWFDFWSGEAIKGDQLIQAQAPLSRIPLYVRAGSILPLGPENQYANENGDGPITLRVYRGADAQFDLYEDGGDGYEYEKGQRAIIPIRWNEATRTLSFAERSGTFPSMTKQLTFRIVWVSKGHGIGESAEPKVDKTVFYDGNAIAVRDPERAKLN